MRMSESSHASLWSTLSAAGDLSGRFVCGADARVALSDLIAGSALDDRGDDLAGRSVLIMTADQFTAALVMLELDGVARRMVLYPPDLALEHLPYVVEAANVDAIVSDQTRFGPDISRVRYIMPCAHKIVPRKRDRGAQHETEWILLTSGTTGRPKLVAHTLETLTGAIHPVGTPENTVWSTFYDIRRYGGLQIFLRAALTGTSLVLSSASEPTANFLERAASEGVTHISGTPSHWRRAMMSPSIGALKPQYVRLSGEIADQAILNQLHAAYPQAKIAHAFASTEAGVAFAVNDGLAGFPATVLNETPDVEMKIENRTLWIRSRRTASRYLGDHAPRLKTADGFVDTGDMIELQRDRFYFVGRRDGLINVGGLKVHPEEVEAVINRHPEVHMSLVRAKKNPVIGAVVVADVVLRTASQSASRDERAALQSDILLFCREALSSHKVPVAINFVPGLAVAESGKMMRGHA